MKFTQIPPISPVRLRIKNVLSSGTWISLYEFVAQTIVMMYHVCHLKIGLNFSRSTMVEVIRREIGNVVRVDKCEI